MNRRKTIVACVVMLMLVVIWWVAWYRPAGDDIARANREYSQEKAQMTALEGRLERLRELMKEEVAQQATLLRYAKWIPSELEMDELIDELNTVAEDAGVSWSSFEPRPVQGDDKLAKPTVITMKLTGRFQTILDYLRGMMHMERLIVVDSIELTSVPEESSSSDESDVSEVRISDTIDPELTVTLTTRAFSGGTDVQSLLKSNQRQQQDKTDLVPLDEPLSGSEFLPGVGDNADQ